jgi:RND family efflux transporter MFP subunit
LAAQPAAQPAAAPATPATADPERLEILSVLSVEQEVDVLAQRAGAVVEILHDQGAQVAKGSVLARLDDRALVAELDRARADLAVAESNVKFNEAELRARQAAHKRAQQMRKEGLNSDADLEEAEFRAKGAEFDLEAWRSVVERNKASIRMLELDLEKTRIRAPFDGMIIRRYVQAGQNVLQDERAFRVGQMAPLLIRFLVPETSPRRPRNGDALDVLVGLEGRRLAASITRVGPTVDPASGSYDVTARVTGDTEELRPGMAVRVVWAAGPGAR